MTINENPLNSTAINIFPIKAQINLRTRFPILLEILGFLVGTSISGDSDKASDGSSGFSFFDVGDICDRFEDLGDFFIVMVLFSDSEISTMVLMK